MTSRASRAPKAPGAKVSMVSGAASGIGRHLAHKLL
ncbi:MAG: hypothetical protein RL701_2786, partial [Pseudomonadota bacterium]